MDNFRFQPSPIGNSDGFGPPTLDAEVLKRRLVQTARSAIGESAQRRGQRLIVGGFAVTLVGVAMYCVALLEGTPGVDLDTALLRGGARILGPFLAIAFGSLVWCAGAVSFYLGAFGAGEPTDPAGGLAEFQDPR